MRRWIALLLLVLLPLQAVWAAAAPYCQHEGDPAPQHIGHHQPEHGPHAPHADPAPDETGDASPGSDAHSDCHVCHGGTVLPHVVETVQWAAGPSLPDPEPARGQPAPPSERPERPKWPVLA